MAQTKTPETKSATLDISKDSTHQVTLGDAKFEVTGGSGNVTVYAEKVRVATPGRHAAQEAVYLDVEGDTPAVTTSGIIRPTRAAPPVAVAPVPVKDKKKARRTAEKTEKVVADSSISQYFPKLGVAVGENTGDGWVCVDGPTVAGKFLHGASAPVKVAKLVGDVSYSDLEKAAEAESAGKVQNVHIPEAHEVSGSFNAVAELVAAEASAPKAVWVSETPGDFNAGTTAVSLADGKGVRVPKNGPRTNNGVLFGKFKK